MLKYNLDIAPTLQTLAHDLLEGGLSLRVLRPVWRFRYLHMQRYLSNTHTPPSHLMQPALST